MFARICLDGGMDQVTFEFFLSALALLPSAALAFRYNRSLFVPKGERLSLLALGVLITATNLLLISSYIWIPCGTATTLHFLYPIIVTLLSWLFYRTPVGRRVTMGLFACLAGTAFFLLENPTGNIVGISCAMLSSLTYSLYIILLAQKIKKTPAFVMVFYLLLTQLLICCAVSLSRGTLRFDYPSSVWGVLLLLAILNGIAASVLFRKGLERIGASRAAVLSLFEPIVSIVTGALVLKDPFTAYTLFGCLCTIFGLFLAMGKGGVRQDESPEYESPASGAAEKTGKPRRKRQ